MGYEIDSNTYISARRNTARDTFSKKQYTIDEDTELDSVWASFIEVDEDDRAAFEDLSREDCLAMKIQLGYITIKA